MSNANGHDGHGNSKKVTSLRDLSQAVEPPRDLWAGIEAQINAQRLAAGKPAPGKQAPEQHSAAARRPAQMRWLAVAAMIGALAVGIWIGRSILPTVGPAPRPASNTLAQTNTGTQPNSAAAFVQAAYLADPKFREQRAALVKNLEAKLASLPPDSRTKVISSLATIHKSMQDLEAALGKDPTNALLQELLLNTYQDEMRVLTTVHEASDTGKGI
jgi:hypothetical protein